MIKTIQIIEMITLLGLSIWLFIYNRTKNPFKKLPTCSWCNQPNPNTETENEELLCEACDSKRASKDF